jgi:hypothetical protein
LRDGDAKNCNASIVLEYAPELVAAVVAGETPLNEVCSEAQRTQVQRRRLPFAPWRLPFAGFGSGASAAFIICVMLGKKRGFEPLIPKVG